jgi:glycosyltransferase involved in cell wall biosynthesis
MANSRYVLITACRNEAAFVDALIGTVTAQTLPPLAWVIVDDGSSDSTYQLAQQRAKTIPYLVVAQMPTGRPRSFSSQVFAAQHAYQLLRHHEFDFVGYLDADISLPSNYYERVIAEFSRDSRIGLCGGMLLDKMPNGFSNIRVGSEDYHMPGGIQFFRRECFDQIGGHHPIEGGGQDTVADIMTLMHGYVISTIDDLQAIHLRPHGVSKHSCFIRGYHWGLKFYLIGYHPLYYLAQCIRRISERPIFFAAGSMLLGFFLANLLRPPRPVDRRFITFLRRLQLKRLRSRAFSGISNRR